MQRREIDYILYHIWFFVLLIMFFVIGLTWAFCQRGDEEVFTFLLNVAYIISLVLLLALCTNIAIYPLVAIILTAIDKKRNPEKYKRIAEINREIDKMMTELDEEIEKIIKENENGKH